MSRSRFFCSASVGAVIVTFGVAGQAAAQAQSNVVEEVVVTGSFIRGTPEDAALPVDVISSEDLAKQGAPSTVELLKALPVSSGVLGDTNQFDPRAQGSEGSGSVNLRGLGAQRTLVLINGRRMSPNPFGQAGAGIVDTNIVPSAAIGRVEVLKDGAAATYGSDAIGGVVNFITRTNVDGLEASASYRYIDGSDGDYTASLLWGKIWDNGNVLLSAGWQHRSVLQSTERSFANRSFFDNPEGGWSAGNAVAPFFPVTQNAAGAYVPAAAAFVLDNGCAPLGGVVTPGALPACQFHFINYDNLVEKENRYQVYAEANADLSENVHMHVEALYAFTDVPDWKTSPSYLALQTPTSTTNPATGLPASLLAGYFVPASNPGFIAYRAANPTAIPAIATGVHIPGVRYRPLSMGGNPAFDYGPSEGLRQFEAYRVSGGLKGEFSNGIGWDVAVTYGQETGRRTGYDTIVSRFQLALRGYGSLATGANGGCTAAETNGFTTNAGNTAIGCYYFNPFSNGVQKNAITGAVNPGFNASLANNPDLVRWFFEQVSTKQTQRVFVADAVLNGTTGITLPGGDLAWALGTQFRRSGFQSSYNDLSNVDATPCIDTPVTGNSGCAARNGALMFLGTGEEADLKDDVYAVFGELSVPVTDDLQFQLAARYEDYGGEVGSTFNPKISGRWQLTDWFALRGSAGTTFRGPPLTQLQGNSSVTALSFIAGSFRAIDLFGNANLEPETADTFSLGGIFKLGNFRATLDWWDFKFKKPIVAEPSASVVNAMFPGGSTANCGQAAFAGLQSRFTFQGACSTATISRVRTSYVNGPQIKTSGVDLLADLTIPDVYGGDLKLGLSGSYTLEYKIAPFTVEGVIVEKGFDAAGKLNYQLIATSLPQLKGSVFAEYTRGPHNLRWTINFVDSYVDQRTSIFAPNAVTGVINPNGAKVGEFITHEIDYRVFLPWDTTATISVDNVFDKNPPFARLDLSYDPFTASGLGRTFKVSLMKKF